MGNWDPIGGLFHSIYNNRFPGPDLVTRYCRSLYKINLPVMMCATPREITEHPEILDAASVNKNIRREGVC